MTSRGVVPPAARPATRVVWRDGVPSESERVIPEETPVALTYNRSTHAVMMATPADLEDFAIGFSLAEGLVGSIEEIEALEVVALQQGIELRMDLAAHRLDRLTKRQRRLAGPTGCGLCGMDSLDEALRPVPRVPDPIPCTPGMILAAMDSLAPAQRLNATTRAVHAAGLWTEQHGLVAVREDVGRHNALDKLAGAIARQNLRAANGIVVLSSRVSVEMIQKAALLGAPLVAAVSAPTALAVRMAEVAGITLVGVARADGFEVFSHPDVIVQQTVKHVA